MATKSLTNVSMSHADVTFDGVSLGYIEGGVELNFNKEVAEIFVDDFGNVPAKINDVGTNLEVSMTLTQYEIATLEQVLPEGATNTTAYDIGGVVGQNSDTLAKELVITPANTSLETITVFHAHPISVDVIPFKNDEQLMFSVTFKAVVDPTTELVARIGATT